MKFLSLSLMVLSTYLSSVAQASEDISFSPIFLDAPESVYVDDSSNQIYISNVAGDGLEYDGNGWISKFDMNGKMLSGKWIKNGLNAPKGMAVFEGKLYVADIKNLVVYDVKTGGFIKKTLLPDAIILNDITIDRKNKILFVSDTIGNTIYELDLATYKFSVTDSGEHLESPNGLFYSKGRLIVGSWGIGIRPDWSTEEKGSLYSLNLTTKEKKILAPNLGQLDGVEIDPNKKDIIYVSDWVAGVVYSFELSTGRTSVIATDIPGAADLGLRQSRGGKTEILVPSMSKNEIKILRP